VTADGERSVRDVTQVIVDALGTAARKDRERSALASRRSAALGVLVAPGEDDGQETA
jgi:hypothetical protein